MTTEHTRTEAGVFEMMGVSGVSLARGQDVAGIRMGCPHPALGLLDDAYVLYLLDPPDAYAPDLSYVRYAWRVPVTDSGVRKVAGKPCTTVNSPFIFDFSEDEAVRLTLEWRFDGEIVTGRYLSSGPVRVALFVNACFGGGGIDGASADGCRLRIGESDLVVRLSGPVEEPLRVDSRDHAEQAWSGEVAATGRCMALYPVELAPGTPLHFAMRIGADSESGKMPDPVPADIDAALVAGSKAYQASRMQSTGLCDGAATAIAALAGFSRAYDPQTARVQTTVNRTWGAPNSPAIIFGWDNFFTSYIAAWENPRLGAESLEHIVSVYGRKPIAHGPVQRNLIIPILYTQTLGVLNDEALAQRTWPTMMKFMRFWFDDRGDGHPWRDGNDDGLIESGTNEPAEAMRPGHIIQEAMDETGYDEIPTTSAGFTNDRLGMLAENVDFDWHRRTLTITEVGQNSLYVASCHAMGHWARRLGLTDDAEWLAAEGERVSTRMRERLLCKEVGYFRDRYWEGGFSPVKTMTLFYPLLAGIADESVKERLRDVLLDPAQFWGDNLMPTVSRDDPAYCDGLDGTGNYWRGNCWPSETYIVYLAIKEAGWDEIAAEFAKRTCAMFMDGWSRYGHAYENWPAEGGVTFGFPYVRPWGGREIRYVWSAMMLFCGLEEVFGCDVLRGGLRFGNPYLPRQSAWNRFQFGGRRVEAEAGPDRTRVSFGDQWQFAAEPGVVVRAFHHTESGCEFVVTTAQAAKVTFRTAAIDAESRVFIDDNEIGSEIIGEQVSFPIPGGQKCARIRIA